MSARLQQFLTRLSERERRIMLLGAVVAVVLFILATILPLQRSVNAIQQRVERKRDDLSWLRSMAPQLAGLQSNTPPALHEPLVVLIDRSARDAGLHKSLVGTQPSGDGGLSVRLDQTPFDALVAWLSDLHERYGVQVESATISPAKDAGSVNASLVLHAG